MEDVLQEAREEDGYSSISAKNDARTTADTLRSIAFAMLKNGWRRGFLEMPSGSCSATTPFKACKATCVGLDSAESAAEGDDDEATGADALSREFCFLRILRFFNLFVYELAAFCMNRRVGR